MKRVLSSLLWIAVLLFVVQVAYFLFFVVRGPKYNEGRPLTSQAVSVPMQNITALYRDGGETVWIGTDGHGLGFFSQEPT